MLFNSGCQVGPLSQPLPFSPSAHGRSPHRRLGPPCRTRLAPPFISGSVHWTHASANLKRSPMWASLVLRRAPRGRYNHLPRFSGSASRAQLVSLGLYKSTVTSSLHPIQVPPLLIIRAFCRARQNRVGHRGPVCANKAGVAAAIHPRLHRSAFMDSVEMGLRDHNDASVDIRGRGSNQNHEKFLIAGAHSRGASLAIASVQPCLKCGKKASAESAAISSTHSVRESRLVQCSNGAAVACACATARHAAGEGDGLQPSITG
jgi:hypothetical protein